MFDYTDEDALAKALEELVKELDGTAKVLTYNRLVAPNTLLVATTFLIMCKANNFTLVKALMKAFLPERGKIVFANSQLNLESGNLDIDYLYVKAEIKPKLN